MYDPSPCLCSALLLQDIRFPLFLLCDRYLQVLAQKTKSVSMCLPTPPWLSVEVSSSYWSSGVSLSAVTVGRAYFPITHCSICSLNGSSLTGTQTGMLVSWQLVSCAGFYRRGTSTLFMNTTDGRALLTQQIRQTDAVTICWFHIADFQHLLAICTNTLSLLLPRKVPYLHLK